MSDVKNEKANEDVQKLMESIVKDHIEISSKFYESVMNELVESDEYKSFGAFVEEKISTIRDIIKNVENRDVVELRKEKEEITLEIFEKMKTNVLMYIVSRKDIGERIKSTIDTIKSDLGKKKEFGKESVDQYIGRMFNDISNTTEMLINAKFRELCDPFIETVRGTDVFCDNFEPETRIFHEIQNFKIPEIDMDKNVATGVMRNYINSILQRSYGVISDYHAYLKITGKDAQAFSEQVKQIGDIHLNKLK